MLRNNLICTMYNRKRNIIKLLSDFFKEEDGIGVVEILLILVVLISLVLMFKSKLTNLVNSIFTKITNNANQV